MGIGVVIGGWGLGTGVEVGTGVGDWGLRWGLMTGVEVGTGGGDWGLGWRTGD